MRPLILEGMVMGGSKEDSLNRMPQTVSMPGVWSSLTLPPGHHVEGTCSRLFLVNRPHPSYLQLMAEGMGIVTGDKPRSRSTVIPVISSVMDVLFRMRFGEAFTMAKNGRLANRSVSRKANLILCSHAVPYSRP